ncbi:hypothetical protein BN2475_760002 [Paraburkholderia ribeironis]|uniref:Uncharacterized protein n=1 Tax=Paraburkholderia ribeironis TaxID=1247936 RepID=A0A1N7SJN3_9BURK|nr:hypothetical protein BN2475_760002 [Paraburkholderia ribeironis]
MWSGSNRGLKLTPVRARPQRAAGDANRNALGLDPRFFFVVLLAALPLKVLSRRRQASERPRGSQPRWHLSQSATSPGRRVRRVRTNKPRMQ